MKYAQVSELATDFRKTGLSKTHYLEYFKLLEISYDLVRKDTLGFFLNKLWAAKDYETLFECVSSGHTPISKYYLGLMTSKGIQADSDPGLAYDYLKSAFDEGYKPASYALFDLLWKLDNPETFAEMVSYVEDAEETGDRKGCMRLVKAYREGKGVKKNIDRVISIQRILAKDNAWSRIELCDALWDKGTPEALQEAFGILSVGEDHNSLGRLGIAYRDGKGVGPDSEKARDCFEKASKINSYWKKPLANLK